jgi:hypothetical protein
MLYCPKCNCTVGERPFVRVNPLGEKGIFWCESCCSKYEPELYKNHKEEESEVEKTLKKMFYEDNSK